MAAVSEKAMDNQRKYKQEYAKNKYRRVPLDVSKEYHEYIKEVAKEKGMSLTAYIKEGVLEGKSVHSEPLAVKQVYICIPQRYGEKGLFSGRNLQCALREHESRHYIGR